MMGIHSSCLAVTLGLLSALPAQGAEPTSAPEKPGRDALLPSVDLRPLQDRWGLAPRLQGKRNTCSVFVVTGALEFALAKKEDRGSRLSVEFLNWASDDATGDREDGSFFSDLWKGFEARGACLEEHMTYLPEYQPGLEPSPEALAKAKLAFKHGFQFHWIKPWDPSKGLDDEQLREVRKTIAAGWPVCGGFLWPKAESWANDILQICPREHVRDGHSVLLVGYRDDPGAPGGGVFIVRNSASEGKDGFLTYEYIKAYMNDAAWIGFEAREEARVLPAFGGLAGAFGPPPASRNQRISSNEQPAWNDADFDLMLLVPGQVLELPVLEGPGAITHMWFTSHAGWVGELDSLSLRIYWDGRKDPGVEVPLGDFFAVGQGRPAVVESFPVQVSPSGSLTCYWRMPFLKSARIVITNDNPHRTAGLYWQVDWVQLDSLPPETPYFHARYRQEHPAGSGRDYLIADLEGRGHYVGTVLSVTLAQDGWFGEGDDFFYIDGEKVPSLQGTGTEDYFGDAWGFRERTSLWFGQPRWQGDHAGDSGVCYRWHLLDPVAFTRSLKLSIEHKGDRDVAEEGSYIERPDFLSSVAFWYQAGEPRPFGELPPYPRRRVPWRTSHLVKAFRQARSEGGPKPEVRTEGFFGARPVLAWPNDEVDARWILPFEVDEDGRYAARLTAMGAPGQGLYDIELDAKVVLPSVDFRSAETAELDILLGTHSLSKGPHELAFRALETSRGSAAPVAVELLRLLMLPPEATREVKTPNEAHFVRLAIGRAVYAYRLAHGGLPESLEALVKSGILAERYLKDESGAPLASKVEGESFVVESQAPGGWKHGWQGLDARR